MKTRSSQPSACRRSISINTETMATGNVLIIDDDPQRRAVTLQWLRAHDLHAIEGAANNGSLETARHQKPDLILIRLGPSSEIFNRLTAIAESSGTLVVPFLERSLAPHRRRETLALNVPGFINEALPEDEQLASIRALIRQKRAVDALRAALQ